MPGGPSDLEAAIAEAKKKIAVKKKEAEIAALTAKKKEEAEKKAVSTAPHGAKKQEIKRTTVSARDVARSIVKMIEKQFPSLAKDLKSADMNIDASSFISRAILLAFTVSLMVGFALIMLASTFDFPILYIFPIVPIVFISIFVWMLQFPRLKIAQKETELDKDVLFAGRDMLIALKSGVPLFNAMANVSKNYGVASREFAKIVERVQSGVPAEVALQEAGDLNTSRAFRQIILQIVTSLRSGSDVAVALEIVLNQISQEQVIALKRYGQKLNPITMFYMLFGIILPSLGIAIGIILTSFVNIRIDFTMLIIVLLLLGLLQYMFFALMRSSRPNFEV